MSVIDSANTLAEKKIKTYIDAIDYSTLTGIEATELMQAYLNNSDYVSLKTITDYFMENGLPFDRASIVPSAITYASGKVPSISLKFVYILNKLYQYTQEEGYNTEALNCLNILNANMVVNSGAYNTTPLSTAALIFDSLGTIITNFKSGTYISDLNPFTWYLNGYDTTQMIDFLYDAQADFKTDYGGMEGLLSPFYVRTLNENSTYGTYNTFVFNGCLGNETNLMHQYEAILSLSKYYYGRYKQNSDKDIKARAIIEKFFNYIQSQEDYYSTIAFSDINTDSENINTDMSWVNTDTLSSYALSGTVDLGDLCRIGMSAVYKYQIDLEDDMYDLATNIYNQVIALQQTDGTIQETVNNTLNQILAFQFIALYNKINYKSWYDIINSALRLYNISEINDNNVETHEENYTLEACRIGADEILGDRMFGFAYTNTKLDWVEGQYSWYLPDYDISMHKIDVVDFRITNPGKLYEPFLMSFPQWKRFYDSNPSLTGMPLRYAINTGYSINPNQLTLQNGNKNETLYVYPIPDKDYEINIVSYKLEPYIYDFNQYPEYLPLQWYQVLKYFIAYKIGVNRSSPLIRYWQNKYAQALSQLEFWDSTGNAARKELPTNFSFGRTNTGSKSFDGFTAWEGVC